MSQIQEQKKQAPSAFFLLFLILIGVTVITYIIPAGKYITKEVDGRNVPIAGTYKLEQSNPQGIFDLLQSPLLGFTEAISICLYVLVMGGFLGIVKSTGAIDNGLKALTVSLKGRELILVPILSYLIGFGGSSFGMEEETVAFTGILVMFFISAGYDSALAVMCIFPSAITGVGTSILNPFLTGISANFLGINMFSGAVVRFLMFVIYEAILSFFIIRYAKMIKENPKKSIVYDEIQAIKDELNAKNKDKADDENYNNFDSKQKLILWLFGASYLIMIVTIIPWSTYGFTGFTAFNDFLLKFPIVGHTVAIGDWYFTETPVIFLVSAVIIGLIAGYKENKIAQEFMEGAKDMLPVMCVIAISRGISIILRNGHIDATLLNFGEENLKDTSNMLYIVGTFLFYIPLNLVITSTSALSTLTMPILGPLTQFKGISQGTLITAFGCSIGIINIITPASGVLMAQLNIARIPYVKWLKLIMPYIITVFVLDIIILSMAVYFNIQ